MLGSTIRLRVRFRLYVEDKVTGKVKDNIKGSFVGLKTIFSSRLK